MQVSTASVWTTTQASLVTASIEILGCGGFVSKKREAKGFRCIPAGHFARRLILGVLINAHPYELSSLSWSQHPLCFWNEWAPWTIN
jgi:hypothetical protein